MAEQSGKRRGRPRKVVAEPEVAPAREGAAGGSGGEREDCPSDADRAPEWPRAVAILNATVEAVAPATFGRVEHPNPGADLFKSHLFACKIVKGERFRALLTTGEWRNL